MIVFYSWSNYHLPAVCVVSRFILRNIQHLPPNSPRPSFFLTPSRHLTIPPSLPSRYEARYYPVWELMKAMSDTMGNLSFQWKKLIVFS